MRRRRGLPLPDRDGHYSREPDALFDRLADAWEPHLDPKVIQAWLNLPAP